MFRVLHYINEVYSEKSFSKAAQKLFVSQSSLSLTVKKYELDIGVQIFDRSTVPVQLTDEGREVIAYIQKLLSAERELQTYLDDVHGLRTGCVTLGAAHMFANHLLPCFIAEFLGAYPNIKVDIAESDFLSLKEAALRGDIDLLVESHDFDGQLFTSYPLYEEAILFAVPADDPENKKLSNIALTAADVIAGRHKDPAYGCLDLSRFASHQFLMLEKGHDMHGRGFLLCRENGFEPTVSMYLNQLTTAYSLAGQHLGVTFVSDTAVRFCDRGAALIYYKLAGANAMRHINMAYKRGRYTSSAMKAFINTTVALSAKGLDAIHGE